MVSRPFRPDRWTPETTSSFDSFDSFDSFNSFDSFDSFDSFSLSCMCFRFREVDDPRSFRSSCFVSIRSVSRSDSVFFESSRTSFSDGMHDCEEVLVSWNLVR